MNSPRLLYPQERTPVPTEQEADRAPEPIWTFCRTVNSLAPIKIRTPGLPSHRPVAVPTASLRLDVVLLTLDIRTYSYLFIYLVIDFLLSASTLIKVLITLSLSSS